MTKDEEGMSEQAHSTIENAVYLADASKLSELPDGSVALVLTSPPYFNIKDYALDGRQEVAHSRRSSGQIGDVSDFNDYLDALSVVWRECARVLRPNGKLIINSPLMPMLKREYSTHENRHIFDLNSEIQQSILKSVDNVFLMDTYIWNRTNPSKSLMFGSYPYPTNFYAQNTIEFVSVYVKGGKAPSFPKDVREHSKLSQSDWVEMTRQVWDLPVPNKGDKAFGEHAALMPEGLAERCIRLYSMVNDVVLDPFAGSGTTLKVARDLRRRFVGYEVVSGYADIIESKTGVKPQRPTRKPSAPANPRTDLAIPARLLDTVHVSEYSKLTKRLPDNSADLVCIDPPYNLGIADWDTFQSHNAFMSFTRAWLSEAVRVLKPGGALWIFNTPRNAAYILAYLESRDMQLQNWITWNKRDGFSGSRKKFVAAQETILYLVKPGGEPYFNADAVRVPYESTSRIEAAKTRGILKNGKRWYPNAQGKLCTDVWNFASDRHVNKVDGRIQKPRHPTVKPLSMMQRILLATSREGDVVVDFFCGSGSTLVAAKSLNRRFVGGDADEKSVEISLARLEETEWGMGVDERAV